MEGFRKRSPPHSVPLPVNNGEGNYATPPPPTETVRIATTSISGGSFQRGTRTPHTQLGDVVEGRSRNRGAPLVKILAYSRRMGGRGGCRFAGGWVCGWFARALALAVGMVQIGFGRLAKDVPLANRVRSGRKQP